MAVDLVARLWSSGGDQNEEGDGVSGLHHTQWVY